MRFSATVEGVEISERGRSLQHQQSKSVNSVELAAAFCTERAGDLGAALLSRDVVFKGLKTVKVWSSS